MAKKILIADDDDHIRELIHVTLEDEGWEIFEARDGIEAVSRGLEVKPDLVILDVMMPGKVGYEVCQELKQNPATQGVYVIFLTARGSALAQMTGKLQGGDEFLTKPFEPADLRERVKKALERT